eukprot:m.80587 g.80587  ORF g.80587 m.80587 type:complete len:61 (+) comp8625_c0_seq6:1514-1696(+)
MIIIITCYYWCLLFVYCLLFSSLVDKTQPNDSDDEGNDDGEEERRNLNLQTNLTTRNDNE